MGLGIAQSDTSVSSTLSRLFSSYHRQSSDRVPTADAELTSDSAPAATGIVKSHDASVQNAYDAMVYTSRLSRISFSGSLTSGASLTSGDTSGTERTAQQIEFSFVNELRGEALAQFQQRTQAVADALGKTQQSTYAEASRSVAARFEASFKVSGEALNGFAAASEGAQGSEDIVNRLVELANQLLERSDDFFNDIMGLLGGFFSGTGEDRDYLASFQKLFDEMFAQYFGGNAGSPVSGNAAQFTSVQMEFKFSFEVSIEITATEGQVQQSDPLVFDLDGDGIELTNYRDGARFDLLGNGQQVQAAFVTGGDAFLALDRNGDGLINSGKELFGEQNGAKNGFEELRKLDSNKDGVIDGSDRDFDKLLLFRDNGNGITEEGELVTLAQAGIEAINLGYTNTNERAAGGNILSQIASFRHVGGAYGRVADALLNYTV